VTSPPHLHICDPAQHSGGSSGLRFCTLPPLVCPVSYWVVLGSVRLDSMEAS
jgi:hypothetical protein